MSVSASFILQSCEKVVKVVVAFNVKDTLCTLHMQLAGGHLSVSSFQPPTQARALTTS